MESEAVLSEAELSIDASTTPKQRRRYLQVVNATLELIEAVGTAAVTMEAISSRSDVALATIYRYFQSRDKLIFVATDAWLRKVVRTVRAEQHEENPLQLMVGAMKAGDAAFQTRPRILEAWVTAKLSRDPHTQALARQNTFYADVNRETFGRLDNPELVEDLSMIMECVWFASLVSWVIEEGEYHEVTSRMERAVRLAFRAHNVG